MTVLRRLTAAYVGTWVCVIVGTVAWVPAADRLGRDFRPIAVTAALLLLGFGVLARRRLGWGIWVFLGNAGAAEVTLLLVISHFSGFSGTELLKSFNIEWWANLSLFVGFPWLAGYVLGSAWLKLKSGMSRSAVEQPDAADEAQGGTRTAS